MDSNPRVFFLDVTNVEANVDANQKDDFVTLEFHGRLGNNGKERIEKALKEGRFEITSRRML